MVEATPTGLGRDPASVARISEATGLGVGHLSGAQRSGVGRHLTEQLLVTNPTRLLTLR